MSRSAAPGPDEDAVGLQEMQISIDSQSFVNLGQLMGSRHGVGSATARGSNAPGTLADDLGASCLSDDGSEGMHDFDQIFHPRAEQGGGGGGSSSSAWSGRELYGGSRPDERGDDDDDDNDSLLPALPSRSCTPGSPRGGGGGDLASSNKSEGEAGWAEEDFATTPVDGRTGGGGDCGGRGQPWASAGALRVDLTSESEIKVTPETQRASLGADFSEGSSSRAAARAAVVQTQPSSDFAAGGGNSPSAPHFLRDSWLHIPLDGGAAGESESERIILTESTSAAGEGGGGGGLGDAGIASHQQRYHDAAEAAARARRAAAAALADCGRCLVHAVDKAASLAASPLQQLAQAAREQVDVGAEACARGQQAVIKAVGSVPQAPGERARASPVLSRSVRWRDLAVVES